MSMTKTVAYSFTGKGNGFPQTLLKYILTSCTYQKTLKELFIEWNRCMCADTLYIENQVLKYCIIWCDKN